MEPFEWLLLGAGLAIGSLIGSRGKGLMRSAAKGYLVVADTTRSVTANMREDFRDALEEARYEREEEALEREREQFEHLDANNEDLYAATEEPAKPAVRPKRPAQHAPKSTAQHSNSRRSTKKAESQSDAAPEPAA